MSAKKDAEAELRVLRQAISDMASAATSFERSLRDAKLTAETLEDIIDDWRTENALPDPHIELEAKRKAEQQEFFEFMDKLYGFDIEEEEAE